MRRIISFLRPSLIGVVVLGTVLTGCASMPRVVAPPCATVAAPTSGGDPGARRIELVKGDRVARVVLDDSATSRELLEMLPFSIEVRDSFGLALVGTMPATLDVGGAPALCGFRVGEIAYSAEDRAIAIFHSPDATHLKSPGAVRLGHVTDGLAAITASGTGDVTVRRVG